MSPDCAAKGAAPLDSTLGACLDEAASLPGVEGAFLVLMDEDTKSMTACETRGAMGGQVQICETIGDDALLERVVTKGEELLIENGADDPAWAKAQPELGHAGPILLLPLRRGDQVVGVLGALCSNCGAGPVSGWELVLGALARTASGILALGAEVTRLDDQLSRLRQQREKLIRREKFAAMRQLSAGVAQEIRSPLTAISGYAQLLHRKLKTSEPMRKKVQVIGDLANEINSIINGLLDFSRREDTEWEAADPNDVMRNAVETCRPVLSRFGKVSFKDELVSKLPSVDLDKRQLENVFCILIKNALQAMASKGGTLTVRSGELPPVEKGAVHKIYVEVSDTGIGIPQEKHEIIFKPFFTEGKRDAVGLGLSISRSIMKSHRGALEVRSALGEGATFRVVLPVVAKEAKVNKGLGIS